MEIIVVGPGGKEVARVFSALGNHAVYVAAVSAHTAEDTYWEEVDLLYVMKGAVRQYGASVKEIMRLARLYGTFVLLWAESGAEEKVGDVDFLVSDGGNSDDLSMLGSVKICMYPCAQGVQVLSMRWHGTIRLSGAAKAETAILIFVDQLLRGGSFETALQTAGNIHT